MEMPEGRIIIVRSAIQLSTERVESFLNRVGGAGRYHIEMIGLGYVIALPETLGAFLVASIKAQGIEYKTFSLEQLSTLGTTGILPVDEAIKKAITEVFGQQ